MERETYLPYRPVEHSDCMVCGSRGDLCEDYRSGDKRCIDRQACEARRP